MSIYIFSVHFPLRVESSTQWSNPQNDFQHHSLLVVVAISVVAVVVVVLFVVFCFSTSELLVFFI